MAKDELQISEPLSSQKGRSFVDATSVKICPCLGKLCKSELASRSGRSDEVLKIPLRGVTFRERVAYRYIIQAETELAGKGAAAIRYNN